MSGTIAELLVGQVLLSNHPRVSAPWAPNPLHEPSAITPDHVRTNRILRGFFFAEAVGVIITVPMNGAVKLVSRGLQTSTVAKFPCV
jgi:hypothetical protein